MLTGQIHGPTIVDPSEVTPFLYFVCKPVGGNFFVTWVKALTWRARHDQYSQRASVNNANHLPIKKEVWGGGLFLSKFLYNSCHPHECVVCCLGWWEQWHRERGRRKGRERCIEGAGTINVWIRYGKALYIIHTHIYFTPIAICLKNDLIHNLMPRETTKHQIVFPSLMTYFSLSLQTRKSSL